MSNEIVLYQPRPMELTEKQVIMIASTDIVPTDKRGKVPLIWAAILKGRSIGLDDMTSISEITIVNGRPTYSAAVLSALVRQRGHSLEIKLAKDGQSATANGKRADTGNTDEFTFSMDMAKAAGLAGKDNWKKYPHAMLKARAATQVCRNLFSDCFMGGVYTGEEIEPDIDLDADEVFDEEGAAGETLPEPVTETDSSASGGQARAVGTGSESVPQTWGQLVEWADYHGIGLNELKGKRQELFPDAVKPSDLTAEHVAAVWGELVEKQEALGV